LSFGTTPSQTVGPYFAIGLPWADGPFVVPESTPGAFKIAGTVYDGAGEPVPDHLIETWQADPDGRFARCGTEDGDGTFEIVTVKPGRLPMRDGSLQAPHLAVSVFARGMLNRCVTRIYFGDETEANAADPVLRRVHPDRVQTLIAEPTGGGYRFDIRLQGRGETVFFAV
jgi:protocatechuate 3,4-dioxygenase, alpha subunit